VGAPYVGFSGGGCDDCEELADRPALELDEVPDRFALEVADVADSFRKAPRTSFNAPLITSLELDPCKEPRDYRFFRRKLRKCCFCT